MPYVWTIDSSGLKRFVDDRFLPPCNLCGNPVSKCQESTCAEDNAGKRQQYCSYCQNIIQACTCVVSHDDEPEEPEDCNLCNTRNGCRCDDITDAIKEMEL